MIAHLIDCQDRTFIRSDLVLQVTTNCNNGLLHTKIAMICGLLWVILAPESKH